MRQCAARDIRGRRQLRRALPAARPRCVRVLAAGLSLLVLACAQREEQAPSELHGGGDAPGVPQPAPGATGAFGLAAGEYPLDGLSRAMPAGPLTCPDADVQEFSGERIRFTPAARAIPAFRARLAAFEQIVEHVSRRVYGRAPSRILVAASYDCRAVSGKSRRISEHAFANAIDITGFAFAPEPIVDGDGNVRPVAIPGAFEVRVDRHWHARGDAVTQRHARFLEELCAELVQRELFRTLLGPAEPAHEDHFHFDMAPWKYVHL